MDSDKETRVAVDACSDGLIEPLLLGLTLCLKLLAPSSKVSSSRVVIFLPHQEKWLAPC